MGPQAWGPRPLTSPLLWSSAQLANPITVLRSEVSGDWATKHHAECHVLGRFSRVARSGKGGIWWQELQVLGPTAWVQT